MHRGAKRKSALRESEGARCRSDGLEPSLRRRGGLGVHADLLPGLALVLELHHAVDERVDGVVGAEAHVLAGVPHGAALAQDDVAGDDLLTAELLDPAILRVAVAAVARRADAFLVSHDILASAECDFVDLHFREALPVSL